MTRTSAPRHRAKSRNELEAQAAEDARRAAERVAQKEAAREEREKLRAILVERVLRYVGTSAEDRAEFTRRTGIPMQTVDSWRPKQTARERVNQGLPTAGTLRRLGEALGVSIDWLLGFKVPEKREERELTGLTRATIRRFVHRAILSRDLNITPALLDRVLPDSSELFEEIATVYHGRAVHAYLRTQLHMMAELYEGAWERAIKHPWPSGYSPCQSEPRDGDEAERFAIADETEIAMLLSERAALLEKVQLVDSRLAERGAPVADQVVVLTGEERATAPAPNRSS